MHNEADTGDTHHNGDDGQQQHRMDLVHQPSHVDVEAGGEEQRRQEQRQEHVGADLELVEPDEGIAQGAKLDAAVDHPRSQEAHAHAGDGQQHRMRQAEALGHRHQQAHDHQHHGDRQQSVECIGHRISLPCISCLWTLCRPKGPLAL
jgi:hypothetical protein